MTSDHVKIKFPLERDSNNYPPHDVESMWAVPLGNGTYRIDNIPFFVRGVSDEDVVSASKKDGELYYSGLVSEGGHSTVRLLLSNPEEAQTVRDELRARGCSSEGTNIPGLIAVDVPPSVKYGDVRPFFAKGEDAGRWEFEEGCIAQPIDS